MSKTPTTFPDVINEGSTAEYTAVLKDETGLVIPASVINTLTLTLTHVTALHVDTGTIINDRDEQNVLNANDVTVDSEGNLVFALQTEDTAIQDETEPYEFHRATFQCTFDTTKQNNWDVDFLIRNLSQVSA